MKRAVMILTGLAVAACSKTSDLRVIDGAGASLPYPLYAKWASEYSAARVNYQPLGSGAGVRQVSDGVIDFGATDLPMSDLQLKEARKDLVHVPMTIGAVVIAFHVDGVKELRLTREVVGDIFRGSITRWNDARLASDNAAANLPDAPITVVHRADISGTSAAFTAYLGDPKVKLAGVGARGNDGVTAAVKATPQSIGYVEISYAHQAGLPVALLRNRAGKWVPPDLGALDRAARSAIGRLPEDLRVSIVDAEDEDAYPIAALSFLVLPRDSKERAKAEALRSFVWWGLHDGQRFAAELDYAPLPPELVMRAEAVVKSLHAEGKPL